MRERDMTQDNWRQDTATLETRLGDIYTYFRYLGVDVATAEDLVQEAFIIAWQHLPQLREREKLRGWLYRIAHRCFLRHWQAQRSHCVLEISEELLAAPVSDPGCDERLNVQALRQVLLQLPEQFLHPLILIYWQQLSYQEAATALSLPLGTLAWRVHKGQNLLRNALAEKGATDELPLQSPRTRATHTSDKA